MEQVKKERQSTSTQAQDKMVHYLHSLLGDKKFLDATKKIRIMFAIPENGFEQEIEDEFNFINKLPAYIDERGEETDFQKETYDLTSFFHLATPWIESIRKYILYDQFFPEEIMPFVQWLDLSQILEDYEQCDDEPLLDENGEEIIIDIVRNITDGFPMGIFISPYATRNDILAYVKKYYVAEIEPAQIKYRDKGSKIGQARARDEKVRERDNFIYAHKDLPQKKIMALTNEKFKSPTGGYKAVGYDQVSKIIARRNKKDMK